MTFFVIYWCANVLHTPKEEGGLRLFPFPTLSFCFRRLVIHRHLQTIHMKSHKWQRRTQTLSKHFNQPLLKVTPKETAAQLVALQAIVSLQFLIKQQTLLSLAVLQPYAPVAGSCRCIKSPQHVSEGPAARAGLSVSPHWAVGSSLCRAASVSLSVA